MLCDEFGVDWCVVGWWCFVGCGVLLWVVWCFCLVVGCGCRVRCGLRLWLWCGCCVVVVD